MNFLTDNPKKLYYKFLSASVPSALVVSVYAFVDTIAVGQSEGPLETAAMAVITPLYGLFAFFSILMWNWRRSSDEQGQGGGINCTPFV